MVERGYLLLSRTPARSYRRNAWSNRYQKRAMRKEETLQIKEATPDHPVLDVIKKRWSPRAFADRRVEPETLKQLLEAARWAASSFNEQPWRFILATKDEPEHYARVLDCLIEGNQAWAQHAPVLMLTVARKTFMRNGKPNRHAWHDVGLAMGNLVAQATALGLHVHQMAGILPEKARVVFAIPDDYEVVAGVALGYFGNPDQLPDRQKQSEQKPRSRKPLDDLVFGATWGEAALFLDT